MERSEHFLHGLIAGLWSPHLLSLARGAAARCRRRFEWKILARHHVNTIQASNPIEQHLHRRNIHDCKIPSQRFGCPFGTE